MSQITWTKHDKESESCATSYSKIIKNAILKKLMGLEKLQNYKHDNLHLYFIKDCIASNEHYLQHCQPVYLIVTFKMKVLQRKKMIVFITKFE
jgi:hypothetical protein